MSDSEALKVRYSNSTIFKSYQPEGNISKKLYSIAEKVRYEKLGSEKFSGVKKNIDNHYINTSNNEYERKDENKLPQAFEYFLRVNILNTKINKELEKKLKNIEKVIDTFSGSGGEQLSVPKNNLDVKASDNINVKPVDMGSVQAKELITEYLKPSVNSDRVGLLYENLRKLNLI